jgi:predicted nucleic acid-binding Zn ribbon protein
MKNIEKTTPPSLPRLIKSDNLETDVPLSAKSKRRYAEKICHNPICDFGTKFTPYDIRQKFCSEQCRINYNNDQRRALNGTTYINEKHLRLYEKKLKAIYTSQKDTKGYCAVHISILKYEGINLQLLVYEQENTSTKGIVRWFYEYGTERHPVNNDYYIIHKRKLS